MTLQNDDVKSVWIVSREFARVAEAGGVKNVSTSLSVNLAKIGVDVTVFIPFYRCTSLSSITDYKKLDFSCSIKVCDVDYKVEFAQGFFHGIKIIFILNEIFQNKRAVYVYTEQDQSENPKFVSGNGHFDSFQMNSIFQQAVLHYGFLSQKAPQIIHCQDAATSLTCVFARNVFPFVRFFSETKFVVTIHNAGPGYLQTFYNLDFAKSITGLPENVLKKGHAFYNEGVIEPFLLASQYSTLTTVSPWYADELYDSSNQYCLLARDFVENNIKIYGITNGIDYENYDPQNTDKSLLSRTFNPLENDFSGKYEIRHDFVSRLNNCDFKIEGLDVYGNLSLLGEKTALFVYQGRMVSQKGIEIFSEVAERILSENRDICFLVHGQGQVYLENVQIELAKKYPGKFVYIKGYNRIVARNCVASGDFLVLPSLFEPCCLEDFIAQIYGTIPIAHAVGGLNKIENGQTGFLYTNNSVVNLYVSMLKVCDMLNTEKEKIRKIQIQAARTVKEKYSWETIIKEKYMPLYKDLVLNRIPSEN